MLSLGKKIITKGMVFLALGLGSGVASSAPIPEEFWLPACSRQIAQDYQVPLDLLQAIRIAEGGRVGQSVCKNGDGSCDHGPMQINDGWFDGRWGINLTQLGIPVKKVLENECQNVVVGAWVLASNYAKLKDWRQAVMAYNAGITRRHIAAGYADRVYRWKTRLNNQTVRSIPKPEPKPSVLVMRSSHHKETNGRVIASNP